MSRLEELPPDQSAALSLLLRQRKSYADLAALLQISEQAVHDRAHAALAMLAPAQARGLSSEERLEVGDYLLGQQAGIAERLSTRTFLERSQSARSWAQALAAELAPLAQGQLPEIPAGAEAGPAHGTSHAPAPAAAAGQEQAFTPQRPSSRLGGALILGAILIAVIVAVVLLVSGGGGKPSASATGKGAHAKKTTTSSGPSVHQIVMHSPNPASKSVGVVEVLSEGGKRAFYIEAQNLPPSTHFFYAVWLYNSPTSAEALSKAPPVGNTHRLAGGALLPANAGDYKEILLTRETRKRPKRPGRVVLVGAFSL